MDRFGRSLAPYLLASALAASVVCPASAADGPPSGGPHPELFFAIGRRDMGALKAVLAHGVSPDSRSSLDMTGLMIATASGNMDAVKALLDAGADVNANSPYGNALSFAATAGRTDIAKLLLERGSNANADRGDHIRPLMLASRERDPELVKLILAKKPPVEAKDNNGSTALSYAARDGQVENARLILDAGAKVDTPDNDGCTPLMHAAMSGHTDVVKLLLSKGAAVNAKDRTGRTALLLAACYGEHPETVRELLEGGADAAAKDTRGRTALAMAQEHGYADTANILKAKGAPAGSTSATTRTPREAVKLALPRIEHAMQVFASKTNCASCHHEGVGRLATGFAKDYGYAVNAKLCKEQEQRIIGFFTHSEPPVSKAARDPEAFKHFFLVDMGEASGGLGWMLWSLSEHKIPASAPLSDTAMLLGKMQHPDGAWRFGMLREPFQSSYQAITAMSVRALRDYAPKEYAAEAKERIAKAKQWLLTAPAPEAEDRIYRLLGLKWAGATADERKQAVQELRALQRPDGGWAQLGSLQSDAYATGSALYALNRGGDVSVADSAYQRGVKFLLRTQEDDGTWFVAKRAIPANNYYDAEFPYGQSQYISFTGTCWATIALTLAGGASKG